MPENTYILDLSNTYGAVAAGSYLSCVVWGASTIQTFLYFRNYESDPLALKVLVICLWFLDTANEILTLKASWIILIKQWGRIANLDVSQPELMHHTWVESIVIFAVQVYFIRRIYLYAKKRWFAPAACLVLLASWQMVGTVVYQIIGYGRPLTNLSTPREVGINMSLRACAVVVDVIVAVSMVYLLTRGGTPKLARSKQMVYRLIMIVINSGMCTAIFASATLILLATQPDNLLYCAPELVLCSLYFSTFLANLNARNYVKGNSGVTTFSNLTGVGDRASSANTFALSPISKRPFANIRGSPADEVSAVKLSKNSGYDLDESAKSSSLPLNLECSETA